APSCAFIATFIPRGNRPPPVSGMGGESFRYATLNANISILTRHQGRVLSLVAVGIAVLHVVSIHGTDRGAGARSADVSRPAWSASPPRAARRRRPSPGNGRTRAASPRPRSVAAPRAPAGYARGRCRACSHG